MASPTKSSQSVHKSRYVLYMRLARIGPKKEWPDKATRTTVYCAKTVDPNFLLSEATDMTQRLLSKINQVVKPCKQKTLPKPT
jgi:hypothetical protein